MRTVNDLTTHSEPDGRSAKDCELLLFLAAACLVLFLGSQAALAADNRPNVILFMTDDQGYGDLGIHGNDKIKTPNLDRFGREGTQFTRFYVCPVCAPTRASLMTGRDFYRTGVIHTSRGGAKMHSEEVTIAELLGRAGYRTGIFGKWHLGDNYPMRPQDQGFDEVLVLKSGGLDQPPDKPNSYFDPILWHNGKRIKAKGYCADVFFNSAMQFIEKNRKQRFFIYLPTNTPHTPLQVDPSYSDPYKAMGMNDTTAKVYGMIQKGGRQSERIAAQIDWRPTLLEACGVTKPASLKLGGISLLPLLTGKVSPADWPDRKLFFQVHRGLEPKRYQNCAVVTQNYKLVGYPGTFGKDDLSTSMSNPVLELYSLANDFGEQKDLGKGKANMLAELRQAYDAWFDSVQNERQFEPGVIHIGSAAENPLHLCRYQDATYVGKEPHGWLVQVEHGGEYEITMPRGESKESGQLVVSWQGHETRAVARPGMAKATVKLAAGKGTLDVWLELGDSKSKVIFEEGSLGDVDVRYVE